VQPPPYTNIPQSYAQQNSQHTFFQPSYTQETQHTFIPEPPTYTQPQQTHFSNPPSYTPQQQHTSTSHHDPYNQQSIPYSDSDFVTPMPQTRNFFDFDRNDFDSPGTRNFNESYAHYNTGQSTQPPQPTQQLPDNWEWSHMVASDDVLNSMWAGQGSSSAPRQGYSSGLGQNVSPRTGVINFLGVDDDTDEPEELLGFGHRQIFSRRCFTGSHLFPQPPPDAPQ
jgi:hypothetical protein